MHYLSRSIKLGKGLYLTEVTPKLKINEDTVSSPQSVNHVFCVDISGSMYSSLPKMRQQLKNRIPDLVKESDTITIIVFSGSGQCTTLKECVQVKNAASLQALNEAIDRFMRPQGLTCFRDPVEVTNELISRVKSSDDLRSWIFLSDGGNNDCPWSEVVQELQNLSSKVDNVAIIEYGYYADSNKLSEMAEILGGSKIFSEDFDDYVITFEKLFEGAPANRISFDISSFKKSLRYQQLFSLNESTQSVTVFSSERKTEILIPENTGKLYCLTTEPVGDEAAFDPSDKLSLASIYAAAYVCADRMRYDVTEVILSYLGDTYIINKYCNAFGKQKLNEVKEELVSCAFDENNQFRDGKDDSYVPNSTAYCVLDMIDDLTSDDKNQVVVGHPEFNYSRIGAKSVAKKVLTEEQQTLLSKAGTKLKAEKVLDSVEEVNMRLVDQNAGYPISSLTWNETRANTSMLLKIPVILDLPKNEVGLTSVESFIFRNYAIIKDGILNVTQLPMYLTQETVKKLTDKGVKISSLNAPIHDSQTLYLVEFGHLPIINKKRTESVKASALADDQAHLLYYQFVRKYVSYLKKSEPAQETKSGTNYTAEQYAYLKTLGIDSYKGYSPLTELDKSGDFYYATSLISAVEKFSSIPKIEDVLKKRESGKAFTRSEEFMNFVMELVDNQVNLVGDVEKVELLKGMFDDYSKNVNKLLSDIAQKKFSLILSRKWFADKKDFDDNVVEVAPPAAPEGFGKFVVKFEFREVKQDL